MTLTQLRHFIGLAKAGSFVKASGQLFMTQPALSRSIKALEEELGQLLFDRNGRRIELTPFGRATLERSQALLDDAQALKDAGKARAPTDAGRLRIGLGSGPGALLTSPILLHFARHFPRFHIDIVRANTTALTHMLRDRAVDALVVDARSLLPAPDLRITQVGELAGAFLCRRRHPLARLTKVSFERLRQYPVASIPLSDELARLLMTRYGEAAHPQVLVNYTSDEISHLVHVAQQTDAVLLAVRACAPDLVEIKVVPALHDSARFALVTLANKAQALHLPEIHTVVVAALADLATAKAH